MEGQGKSRDRRLKRCYQGNRLENQLWVMAYETAWPLIRPVVRAWAVQQPSVQDRTAAASRTARRA